MRIDLLGPIRVWDEDKEISVNAAKERSLLAALALQPGKVVSADDLIAILWGDTPIESARKTLQTYVCNLRHALGQDTVATAASGYALRLRADQIDVGCFHALVGGATEAIRSGSTTRARQLLGDAIDLWRGDALTGVSPHGRLTSEAVRLKEEYLSALEARIDTDLAGGRHAEIVGELEVLLAEHPYRERFWGQLMIALYRSERQADALAAYQRLRCVLGEELGLEPGGELHTLELAILNHDSSLAAPDTHAGSSTRNDSPPPVRRSPVRYAVTDDGVHVAYQVFGGGPIDVVIIPGFVCHLDLWSEPPVDLFVRRLASCHRLIIFDRRGSGLSDRPASVSPDEWVMDTRAVLDAVGSTQAVVLGVHCGGQIAALFAANHPDRTRALVMYGSSPRTLSGDGYSFGVDEEQLEKWASYLSTKWGAGLSLSVFAPGSVEDDHALAFWARYQRISASPSAAAAFVLALAGLDVRGILTTITAPTLVVHAGRDAAIPAEAARRMAESMPNAIYAELDSNVHMIWLSDVVEQLTNEIMSFIAHRVREVPSESVLSTVLCVTGTALNSKSHDIARIVERYQGRQQQPDGTYAFDRPGLAVRCAVQLAQELHTSAGIHTSECALLANGDVAGAAADLARRIAESGPAGQVLVTHTVRDLLAGSDLEFEHHGRQSFDTVAGDWDIHTVTQRFTSAGSTR
jgi:DNA-binding SARP family transcriptional activator/pimeloyl-ACP methyl ester carboxylesterase